eukprot:4054476-Amphidinium_carterae.1
MARAASRTLAFKESMWNIQHLMTSPWFQLEAHLECDEERRQHALPGGLARECDRVSVCHRTCSAFPSTSFSSRRIPIYLPIAIPGKLGGHFAASMGHGGDATCIRHGTCTEPQKNSGSGHTTADTAPADDLDGDVGLPPRHWQHPSDLHTACCDSQTRVRCAWCMAESPCARATPHTSRKQKRLRINL